MTSKKAPAQTDLYPVYFLYGPETFLIEEESRRLLERTLQPKQRGFNLHYFNGEEDHAREILLAARTLPMFSSHRFILVRRADELGQEDIESLLPYIEDPSPSTRLVMSGQALGRWKPYLKQLERHGKVIEFPRLKGIGLISWVRKRMGEKGKSLSEEGARFLIEVVGDHLQDLDNALERLFLSVGEKREVELADVEEMKAEVRVSTIYDLTEAIGEQNITRALSILDRAIEMKAIPFRREEPALKRMDDPAPLLLDWMARHFWSLFRAKAMEMDQKGPEAIAEALNLKPWAVRKLLEQGRRFSIASLREALLRCHQADLAIKGGKGEKSLLLEKLVIDLCLSRPEKTFGESPPTPPKEIRKQG
ncbi:MAG: DNA polymerase III subunit delta [Desulfobacterota bacterium]|nr:DNA polymerase III subunit delta [Thermodesulfobacteriota bacterium]